MKVKIQNLLKRGIPLVLALVICLVVIPLTPVSAATTSKALDYRDYITDVTVDGNNDLVTVRLPEKLCEIALCDRNWKTIYSTKGHSFSYDYDIETVSNLKVVIEPFTRSYLSLSNIPSDAKWHLSFRVDFMSWSHEFGLDYSLLHELYFNNGEREVDKVLELNPSLLSEGGYLFETSGTFLSGYEGFSVFYEMNNVNAEPSDQLDITVVSFDIQLSINSYYRALQEMGYTEQIDELKQELESQGQTLDGILQQQEQQNQKLDDIISGSPEEQEKADQFEQQASGAIADLEEAGDALNQIEKPDISASDLVPTDILGGVAFLSYAGVISEFWNNKTLTLLVMTLGGFLIISYILYGGKDS